MPATSQAYHKWFQILPEEQPPNHYRLLRLDLFEASVEKIDEAVRNRADYLQAMSQGKYVREAQAILNEVAKARLCLTKPDRKQVYDQALQLKLNPPPQLAQALPMAQTLPPVEEDSGLAMQEMLTMLGERTKSRSGPGSVRVGKKKSVRPMLPICLTKPTQPRTCLLEPTTGIRNMTNY